jgi:LIVCS family branched-chain amino acid:cation transporter
MAAIYCILTVVGTQSQTVYGISADGGEALYLIGTHYFGTFGGVLLGITVTFACMKTAIGLITSCATTFVELFPKTLSYKAYAILFCLFSFGIANFGLSRIIELSLPVLMFLYPLTITLILLCLFGNWFRYDRRVFLSVTAFTAAAAALDFLNTLPAGIKEILHADIVIAAAQKFLPFFGLGMGWVVPACIGLAIGLALHIFNKQAA